MTGEVLFPEGHLLSREDAEAIEKAGVWSVYVYAVDEEDGSREEVRVFSNKMVDASGILPYSDEELGLSEKVQLDVLLEIIEKRARTTLPHSSAQLPHAATSLYPSI